MALESGNYINDLVITNPTSSDPKSQGDDHLRLVKTILKETLNGFTGAILVTATDTGTATGHILAPSTALVGYTPMLCLLYKALVTNTGALTVNVSGLGVRSIKTMAGADPTAGDIVAGYPMLLMYDGTNFVTLGGSEFLSKTGNQKLTGNFTVDGNELVTGTLGVTSNTTVGGTLGVTGNTTLTGTLGVTGLTTLNAAVGLTRTAGDNTVNLATTSFAMNMLSPTFSGVPISTTASPGTNTTQIATTAFVAAQAFNSALPAQAGNAGKYVTTDGTNASWADVIIPSYLLMAQGIY